MATEAVSYPISPVAGAVALVWPELGQVQSTPDMSATAATDGTGPKGRGRDGSGRNSTGSTGLTRAEEQAQARAPEMELIREAQSGSRAAFDALVRQYEHQVLRLALHLTGSEHDAEDIYQEAFLKAYRYIGNFRFECSFYTWIYRIVTNLCLDQLRRRKTRREDHAVIVDHSGDEIDLLAAVSDDRAFSNPAKELDRKVLGQSIQLALGKLTPRERMVFELKHYQGLRLRTIGEMLNTTEETAKNTLFRATKKLRAQLAELR
ncbi:MAG: RNA polymerase sigma factor [Terracidiphilus sp.]|jgi:RNA polymerase sigma-70 factor (ECF subfamily)